MAKERTRKSLLLGLGALLTPLFISGCSLLHQPDWRSDLDPQRLAAPPKPASGAGSRAVSAAEAASSTPARPGARVIQTGDGQFVRPPAGQFGGGDRSGGAVDGKGVTLNFEKADLGEVVSFILGDLLKHNYAIDPRVQGSITLHTGQPLAKAELLPLLESLLQMNGAALVVADDLYRVVPLAQALLSGPEARLGQRPSHAPGFAVQVVPLHYIGAAAMAKILQPITAKGVELGIDESRNLLTIAAPREQLARLLDTVRMFDVDWIKGLSVGLYPLENAAIGAVIDELRRIFQPLGLDDGVVSFEPLERLNAILVISKQPDYLQRAGQLIANLDTGDYTQARQLRVYAIRNGKAEYYADLLKQLFEETEAEPATGSQAPMASAAPVAASDPEGTAALGSAVIGELRRGVRITPDPVANNILVMASAGDHRNIEAALKKLEVRPRQVLIEATIAEVSLTDNLSYGLQWFIKHGLGSYDATSSLGDFSVLGGSFTTTFTKGGQVRLLFDALASDSKLKILSSPQLMVIDKQTGSIRVGDSIPVVTRQSTSIEDPNAPIAQEVQYRDTGVLLQVVPNIHAGGLVRLEVSVEVSQPGSDTFAAGNVSFLQRTIDSSVVVQSGETVVLGGLILENQSQSESGVPLLRELPMVGKLFSRTVDDARRTELMITLTPYVVESERDAEAVTEELRQRLQGLFAERQTYSVLTP